MTDADQLKAFGRQLAAYLPDGTCVSPSDWVAAFRMLDGAIGDGGERLGEGEGLRRRRRWREEVEVDSGIVTVLLSNKRAKPPLSTSI